MQGNRVGFARHFRMLFDFSGREDRSSFWPYAAAVFAISTLLSALAMIPWMYATLRSMQEYAERHPDKVTVMEGPGHYSIELHGEDFMPDFESLLWTIGLGFLVAIFLYAAAVVRRLHDTGRSGWWGMMPLPFVAFSLAAVARALPPEGVENDNAMGLFFALFASNLLYMLALIALVVLLARKSAEGPNRFGNDGGLETETGWHKPLPDA